MAPVSSCLAHWLRCALVERRGTRPIVGLELIARSADNRTHAGLILARRLSSNMAGPTPVRRLVARLMPARRRPFPFLNCWTLAGPRGGNSVARGGVPADVGPLIAGRNPAKGDDDGGQ
ncbi:hypothetical protein [Rhizobium phage RHph_X2_26]|nr:hypothetical protein [Rhizobium phage RHph_X2_26]